MPVYFLVLQILVYFIAIAYQEQARMSASVRSCRSPLEEFFNHPYTFVKLVLDSNDTFNSINLREAVFYLFIY